MHDISLEEPKTSVLFCVYEELQVVTIRNLKIFQLFSIYQSTIIKYSYPLGILYVRTTTMLLWQTGTSRQIQQQRDFSNPQGFQ